MDRQRNVYGTPKIAPNEHLEQSDRQQRKQFSFILNLKQRSVVTAAIREVCEHRPYLLRAVNVRTNHAHSVVSAAMNPEPILGTLKSYSKRALKRAGLISQALKPWARHGSTIYLWKEEDVAKAVAYVLFGQGDELFTLDK